MKLVWTRRAVRSRAAIFDHIESDDPAAALRMDALFEEATGLLLEHPALGRPGRVPGTRELVAHPSYVIIYDVRVDTVRILHLLHSARRWPLQDQP